MLHAHKLFWHANPGLRSGTSCYSWTMRKLYFLLSMPGLVWGQALNLSPVSAAAGKVAPMTMTFKAPSGAEPTALQWEISYPSPQLGLEETDVAIGSAAKAAGKTLTCHGRPLDAGKYIYRCILAGGSQRVPSGPVAVFSFRVRASAQPGRATVQLSNTMGVSSDGKQTAVDSSQADILIQ